MPPKKGKRKSAKDSKKVKGTKKAKLSAASDGLSNLITDADWAKHLSGEFAKDYFNSLEKQLDTDIQSGEVFPPKNLIFNALNLTPLSKVKVVLLGQDPYHDNGQAMGLAFSVPKGIKVPPSLNNMYKELESDISGFKNPEHGCLDKWADEGVLLLNATLTVIAHKANSHSKTGWQTFTDQVIQVVNQQCNGVVFLLWGKFSHKKEKLIDSDKHTVLKDAHPSPLSFGKFKGCKCFSRANDALKELGKSPVNWIL